MSNLQSAANFRPVNIYSRLHVHCRSFVGISRYCKVSRRHSNVWWWFGKYIQSVLMERAHSLGFAAETINCP